MAKVFPDGWRELEATGADGRELQTLAKLDTSDKARIAHVL